MCSAVCTVASAAVRAVSVETVTVMQRQFCRGCRGCCAEGVDKWCARWQLAEDRETADRMTVNPVTGDVAKRQTEQSGAE